MTGAAVWGCNGSSRGGSDVYPHHPCATAFTHDRRFLDVKLVRVGLGVGFSLPDEEIKTVVFRRRLRA